MNRVMAIAADIPPGTKRIDGGIGGNGANGKSAENAKSREVNRRVIRIGDFPEIREGLVEKLILLVVAPHEKAKMPSTGIEGPFMGEKAFQGTFGSRRVNVTEKKRLGFSKGELHGKTRKRA